MLCQRVLALETAPAVVAQVWALFRVYRIHMPQVVLPPARLVRTRAAQVPLHQCASVDGGVPYEVPPQQVRPVRPVSAVRYRTREMWPCFRNTAHEVQRRVPSQQPRIVRPVITPGQFAAADGGLVLHFVPCQVVLARRAERTLGTAEDRYISLVEPDVFEEMAFALRAE